MGVPSWEEFYCTGLGFIYVGLSNYAQRKPIQSRLPRYALFGVIGYFTGKYLTSFLQQKVIKREVILWDYIKKHPEDFPELETRKFKDVLETWHPVR